MLRLGLVDIVFRVVSIVFGVGAALQQVSQSRPMTTLAVRPKQKGASVAVVLSAGNCAVVAADEPVQTGMLRAKVSLVSFETFATFHGTKVIFAQ